MRCRRPLPRTSSSQGKNLVNTYLRGKAHANIIIMYQTRKNVSHIGLFYRIVNGKLPFPFFVNDILGKSSTTVLSRFIPGVPPPGRKYYNRQTRNSQSIAFYSMWDWLVVGYYYCRDKLSTKYMWIFCSGLTVRSTFSSQVAG